MQTVQQAHWINSHPDKEQLFHETRAARGVSRDWGTIGGRDSLPMAALSID